MHNMNERSNQQSPAGRGVPIFFGSMILFLSLNLVLASCWIIFDESTQQNEAAMAAL